MSRSYFGTCCPFDASQDTDPESPTYLQYNSRLAQEESILQDNFKHTYLKDFGYLNMYDKAKVYARGLQTRKQIFSNHIPNEDVPLNNSF